MNDLLYDIDHAEMARLRMLYESRCFVCERPGPDKKNADGHPICLKCSRLEVRPITPKPIVKRNDPCPCNSGKKFKRCHGVPSE